jgi:hypothetical protein
MRFRIAEITAITLFIAIVVGCYNPQAESSKSYPPHGQLIDIRRFHVSQLSRSARSNRRSITAHSGTPKSGCVRVVHDTP